MYPGAGWVQKGWRGERGEASRRAHITTVHTAGDADGAEGEVRGRRGKNGGVVGEGQIDHPEQREYGRDERRVQRYERVGKEDRVVAADAEDGAARDDEVSPQEEERDADAEARRRRVVQRSLLLRRPHARGHAERVHKRRRHVGPTVRAKKRTN